LAKFQRAVDKRRVYPVVCVEVHVRRHFDKENGAITPTTDQARRGIGPCGPRARYFKRIE
jgi:hypothetical protein